MPRVPEQLLIRRSGQRRANERAPVFRLDGRAAFVSGAAGHLGSAMARALCEAGAHVILNGRADSRSRIWKAS